MNWVRYEDSTRRLSRRDRERVVREKLQEAIKAKREEIRSGSQSKLPPRVLDPEKSYFLRRLINLDKATGGVTWKLFAEPQPAESVRSGPSMRSERTATGSSESWTRTSENSTLQTRKNSVEYYRNTQRLAGGLRCAAVEQKVHRYERMVVADKCVFTGSESSSSGISSQSSVDASTSTSPSLHSLEQRRQRKIPRKHGENKTRSSFSAAEISAMLPACSPDLSKLRRRLRKSAVMKRLNAMREVRSHDKSEQARRKNKTRDVRREVQVKRREVIRSVDESVGACTEVRSNLSSGRFNFSSDTGGKVVQNINPMPSMREFASESTSETSTGREDSKTSDWNSSETASDRSRATGLKVRPASERMVSGALHSRDLDRRDIVPRTPLSPRVNEPRTPLTTRVDEPRTPLSTCVDEPRTPLSTPFSCGTRVPFHIQVNIINQASEARREASSAFNTTHGRQGFTSVEVSRRSFASKTLISNHENSFDIGGGGGGEKRASAVARSVSWQSRVEVRNQVHSNREILASSTVISAASSFREVRNYSASRTPSSHREKTRPPTPWSASTGAATLSVLQSDMSRRTETNKIITTPTSDTSSQTQKSTNTYVAPPSDSAKKARTASEKSTLRLDSEYFADSPRSLATTVLFEPVLNARIDASDNARRIPTFTSVCRNSRPSSPSHSNFARKSVNSVKRGLHDGTFAERPAARIPPTPSFLRSSYRFPEEESIIFEDRSESSHDQLSSPLGNGTQTFDSSSYF